MEERVAPPPTELPFPSKLLLSRRPPLLAALESDDSKYFVDNGIPREPPPDLLPDGKAARNWSWLHVAAAHGSPAILQHLLMTTHRQHIERRSGDGRTPLLVAAEHCHANGGRDCVVALIRAGAIAHAPRKPDGATAAHLCCSAGCAPCLRLLLQRAPQLVDVVCKPELEQPLHIAARCGRTECIGVLCSEGARVEAACAGNYTPLHLAAMSSTGRRSAVRLLLERRASVDVRDGDGRTPLHRATMAGNWRAIAELLSFGADPGCFSVALGSALKAVREAARSDANKPAAIGESSAAWRASLRFARILGALARGGAVVFQEDLASLRLGWNECKSRANRPLHHAGGHDGSGVAPLFLLAQHQLANSLTAENVLPILHAACVLGARRLQSECERLVLQNCVALAEGGAFEQMGGGSARSVLERLLTNVLRRHAALEVAIAQGADLGDAQWREVARSQELELFVADDTLSEESEGEDDDVEYELA